ncbi:hypothetical protein PTSG_07211 [Salpingoeca rosetta]|uniref:Uncharacterized protein n=1 Tax=Salpingoeca rosetta (strain ATCC 50818 / BSB-021) TaxID=946362 RepID=F2UED8_SALR5|nr:uncharacterized protein PTSG_07211 [Salpingoeca rosetta]EGD74988.1 hypothetical protein PTSG_07211 [Salpingoeca rosetta]|eukprot:XP_004992633.1 hypothetical protein PTSG_07211 [Salpingoeca rosetta]
MARHANRTASKRARGRHGTRIIVIISSARTDERRDNEEGEGEGKSKADASTRETSVPAQFHEFVGWSVQTQRTDRKDGDLIRVQKNA